MSRTVNRVPVQVKTPTSKEARNYFHNQYEWLGVNDDRNFVEVDQKYFQDANNLYVDTEGVLRSRPSLKIRTVKKNSLEELTDIDNVWRFVDLTVYRSNKYLYFVTDSNAYTQLELLTATPAEVYLYKIKSRLYIFTSAEIKYYENGVVYDGIPTLYIPIIKQITNNSVEASPESPNEFTTSYKIKYIYDNKSQIDFNTFLGQTVNITINNETISVVFQRNTQFVIVQKYSIAENNLSDAKILGQDGENVPLVEVREIDYSYEQDGNTIKATKIIMRSSYNYYLDANNIPNIHWNIYYSYDGTSYQVLPNLNKTILGKPYLNDNGDTIFVICPDGPYAYKLRGTVVNLSLNQWTNLFTDENTRPANYNSADLALSSINLNTLPNGTVYGYKQSVVVSGNFVDEENYAIVYGDNPTENSSYVQYQTMYCLLCISKVLHKVILFDCSSDAQNTIIETYNFNSSTSSTVNEELTPNTSKLSCEWEFYQTGGQITDLINETILNGENNRIQNVYFNYDGTSTGNPDYDSCSLQNSLSGSKKVALQLNAEIQTGSTVMTIVGYAYIQIPSELAIITRTFSSVNKTYWYKNYSSTTIKVPIRVNVSSTQWSDVSSSVVQTVELFNFTSNTGTIVYNHSLKLHITFESKLGYSPDRRSYHIKLWKSDEISTFVNNLQIEPISQIKVEYSTENSYSYTGSLSTTYTSVTTEQMPKIYLKTYVNEHDELAMIGFIQYSTYSYDVGESGKEYNNLLMIETNEGNTPWNIVPTKAYLCYTTKYDYLWKSNSVASFPTSFSSFLTGQKFIEYGYIADDNTLSPILYDFALNINNDEVFISALQNYHRNLQPATEAICRVLTKMSLSDVFIDIWNTQHDASPDIVTVESHVNYVEKTDFYEPSNYDWNNTIKYCKVCEDGIALFYDCIVDYNNLLFDNSQDLILKGIPIYISANCLFEYVDNAIYSNDWKYTEEIVRTEIGEVNYKVFDYITELSSYYFAKDNELYISQAEYDEDDNLLLYLPKINTEKFASNITNLHPISDKEIAVFFENEIQLCQFDASYGTIGAYRYTKSKIQVGCLKGCDVITTFDGKYIIFNSSRGLAVMSYQEFVASTEQAVTYISDKIYSWYKTYTHLANSANEIKLFRHGYWIIIYKKDAANGFVFDVRNNSWWPVSIQTNSLGFIEVNDYVQVLTNGRMFDLNTSDNEYYDTYNDDKVYKIPWHLLSQKLHFDAINYVKHIVNITLNSTYSGDTQLSSNENIGNFTFRLQANCYRKRLNGNVDKPNFTIVDYVINIVRTYVQRLNYFKVNEFQYKLSNDEDASFTVPLSLASITVKYKIGTEVR